MKICIVWKNDYPWDVRIEKFAVSLRNAGHDVYLLCGNNNKLETEECIDGISVRRLPFVKNNRMNIIISTPFYFNPFWYRMINSFVRQEKIDLIIVRDLPLILIGLFMKQIHHIPLILDMAENYPAMYWKRIKKGGWRAFGYWFTKNPYLMEWVERYAAKKVDHLFVVVEESLKRLIQIGVSREKISIVSNTPDLNLFANDNLQSNQNLSQCFQMIYVGFIQEGRGLDTVVNSLGKLKKTGHSIKLIVIGDGDYLTQLKTLVQNQHLEKMVEFKGWMKNTLIPPFIYSSDVGVIPHRKTNHTDTTIPNKLFDFMACGKPVIVSNANPMRRIVEEEKCGIVFNSGDEDDFVCAVQQAVKNRDALRKMGINGKMAIENKYNWKQDSIALNKAIERFQ